MKKYEYKLVEIGLQNKPIEEWLNEFGLEEWMYLGEHQFIQIAIGHGYNQFHRYHTFIRELLDG